MIRWIFISLVFALVGCHSVKKDPTTLRGVQSSQPPTSEIPDRREFPLNPNINPCQDFYSYVCSEAIAGFKLREDRSRHIFAFSDSDERILQLKIKYLSGLNDLKKKSPRAQTLDTIYQACMNEEASKIEERGKVNRTLLKVEDLKTREEFLKYVSSRMEMGDYSFFEVGSPSNFDDPNWQDFVILGNIMSLPERSYYSNKAVMTDFVDLLAFFFTTIGYDKPRERAQAVANFEKQFAETFPLPVEMRELFTKRTQISRNELLTKYPEFQLDWLIAKIPKKVLIRNITPANYDFLKNAFANENLDILKDVYLVHALADILDDAYPEYFAKKFEFERKHLGGPNQRPVREERCTRYVMNRFNKEVDAETLPLMFPNFDAKKFEGLAEKVRAAIIRGVQNNHWLSEQSKKGAIRKIRSAKLQLVKPKNDAEWDFNPPAKYHKELPIANDRLLNSKLFAKEIRELGQKRDRNRWGMGPMTVNAYYSPSDNKFVMPVGILQYPFYDPASPDHMNLGAVGFVLGHELGHGIDDQGGKFDSTGRLRQWLSDADVAEFQKRGSALVAFYDERGVNGKLTLGENIGDLVGVSFAYDAAFHDQPNATPEMKRAFFIQAGRAWCGVMREKERERRLKVDVHSPMEERVNQPIRHIAGFQEAFSCKSTDPMALPPEKRVKIW